MNSKINQINSSDSVIGSQIGLAASSDPLNPSNAVKYTKYRSWWAETEAMIHRGAEAFWRRRGLQAPPSYWNQYQGSKSDRKAA